jgi:hypothetical protein
MRRNSFMILMVALIAVMLVLPAGEAQARGGWVWGPAAFAGGLLIGTSLARPWYGPPVYVYPPPVVYTPQPTYYVPNQAYAYPDPAITSGPVRGRWVEVPGQSINGVWVPAHKAWAPSQ